MGVDAKPSKFLVERGAQRLLYLRNTLGFLVDDDVVAHEANEACGVLRWVHGRDSLTLAENALL